MNKVKIKIFVQRVKYNVRILGLVLLGSAIGVSYFIAYQEYASMSWDGGSDTVSLEVENSEVLAMSNELHLGEIENGGNSGQDVSPLSINTIEGEFTAYAVGDGFTPGTVMASGKEVYVGAIACPIKYAFGTKITVQGKAYTCEDRMAQRFRGGEYFDIFMDDQNEALSFGRKKLQYSFE